MQANGYQQSCVTKAFLISNKAVAETAVSSTNAHESFMRTRKEQVTYLVQRR
jgi:hypothetical protein